MAIEVQVGNHLCVATHFLLPARGTWADIKHKMTTPWGTFAAGILFGAFRAGAVQMQIQTGTPIDIVLVVQSLIVLFIAAPPLVRAIFRLNPRKKKAATAGKTQKAATTGGAA